MMRILLCVFLLCASWSVKAQIQLNIRQCLDIAVENNLGVRQASNSVDMANVALVQRKFDFLPSVNGSLSLNKNLGTTVDNFTQQIAQSPTTASPNIFASIDLFNGFSKWNSLKAAKYDAAAAQYSLEDLKNDIRISVAISYFGTLFSQDNLAIAEERLELVEKQLERMEKMLVAGGATEGDVLGIKAQVATERVNVVTAKNTLAQNMMNLILSMNLDPMDEYELDRPGVELFSMDEELPSAESAMDGAMDNNPGLKQRRLQIKSSELAVKVSKAATYPTLSMGYGMGSFYSSNRRDLIGFEPDPVAGIVPIYGNTIPLFTQFGDNFGQQVGLSLNVPIFNRYRARQGIFNAKLNLDNTVLSYEIDRNGLYQDVLLAHLDATAAKARYDATLEQVDAAEKSFRYSEQRYEAGLDDFYTYVEALNNKTRADLQQYQSLYDYVLKVKVLELYQGKTLEF